MWHNYMCSNSSAARGGGRSGAVHAATCGISSGEPPLSSSRTSVWYWLLNGIATTVIYNKQTQEIWCNGYQLQPVSML